MWSEALYMSDLDNTTGVLIRHLAKLSTMTNIVLYKPAQSLTALWTKDIRRVRIILRMLGSTIYQTLSGYAVSNSCTLAELGGRCGPEIPKIVFEGARYV